VETAILARHGESDFSARSLCNGDPATEVALTPRGIEEARRLGEALAGEAVDLCVTSEFLRTRQTADVALAGRDVPRLVLALLNDIRFGEFEGRALDDYRAWAHSAGPADECPGGGESRAEAALRFAAGYRALLDRPERTLLVVSHALPIRYALWAAHGSNPAAVMERVGHAEPYRVTAAELEQAAVLLEAWAAEPAFA
jgi:broad specificity phosphatase PhoE